MRDRELHSGGEEEVRDREEEKSREEVDRGGEDEGRDRGGQEEVSESEEEESKEEESEGDGSGEHTSGTSGRAGPEMDNILKKHQDHVQYNYYCN